ncbi:MAG TPA: DUF4178 domain-containing protein [Kofleriaceae bacterium]|nr:DUF4178 domain-containing protein [Kofleriaceae bacterium]
MFWILLLVLTVIGGGAAVSVAASARRKALGPGGSGGSARALPAGSEGGGERTARDPRVNDVLTIDGKDFLVEGLINYDEDGHRWAGARVVDGNDIKWLIVGLERTGTTALRLLTQDESTQIAGYPPEVLVIGEVRYALDKRGAATCALHGDLGPLGAVKKGRPDGHVERARWWLYAAPGDDTLLLEQWGTDYRVLRGKKVNEGTIDLIPGS